MSIVAVGGVWAEVRWHRRQGASLVRAAVVGLSWDEGFGGMNRWVSGPRSLLLAQ